MLSHLLKVMVEPWQHGRTKSGIWALRLQSLLIHSIYKYILKIHFCLLPNSDNWWLLRSPLFTNPHSSFLCYSSLSQTHALGAFLSFSFLPIVSISTACCWYLSLSYLSLSTFWLVRSNVRPWPGWGVKEQSLWVIPIPPCYLENKKGLNFLGCDQGTVCWLSRYWNQAPFLQLLNPAIESWQFQ